MAPHAAKIKQKRDAEEPITKKEEYLLNRRNTLVPYIKNIKTLEASQAVIGEGTGFQTSTHPDQMTKDGKYGKLTIDVPKLVEKHRLLAKDAGVIAIDDYNNTETEYGSIYAASKDLQINSGIIIYSCKNMHKPKKRYTFCYKKIT